MQTDRRVPEADMSETGIRGIVGIPIGNLVLSGLERKMFGQKAFGDKLLLGHKNIFLTSTL